MSEHPIAILRPDTYEEVVDIFGNPAPYEEADGRISPRWSHAILGAAVLPQPLPLSWDTGHVVNVIMCHQKLVPMVEAIFRQINNSDFKDALQTYGGCYNYRLKRSGSRLSLHSWGIAIDLNTATNALGTAGDMDPRIVAVFDEWGWTWGGTFKGTCDPMHFQYASGNL